MPQPLEIQVWSHPDYEGLVADITCEDGVVAIVSEPTGGGQDYAIELFPPPAGKRSWRFEVAALTAALGSAMAELKRLEWDPPREASGT
jgi:hypothetical protein